MTRRSKDVYVFFTFTDGNKRKLGPLDPHDGGRLFRMAERNMREMDLAGVSWHYVHDYHTQVYPIPQKLTLGVSPA